MAATLHSFGRINQRRRAPLRRGSNLIVMLIAVFVVLMVGLAITDTAKNENANSFQSWQREQALMAADAGIDYAVSWINTNGYSLPGTTTAAVVGYIPSSGSTLSASPPSTSLSMPASGVLYQVAVYDGAKYPSTGAWPTGSIVLVSTATRDKETCSVQIVMQRGAGSIFPWNNAVYADGYETDAGSNASIHGPVTVLGAGAVGNAMSFTGGANSGIFNNYTDGTALPTYYSGGQDNGNGAISLTDESGALTTASTTPKVYTPSLDSNGNASLNAVLQVEKGTVAVASGSLLGEANHTAGQASVLPGVYTNAGFTVGSAARVTSANGTSNKAYSGILPGVSLLNAAVPNQVWNMSQWNSGNLTTAAWTTANTPSSGETQFAWDQDPSNPQALVYNGSLTLGRAAYQEYTYPHTVYTIGSYPAGPYLRQTWIAPQQPADNHDDYFNLEIKGIIYVNGAVQIGTNHAGGHGGTDMFFYTGTGTIVAGGTASGGAFTVANPIDVYGQLIASGTAAAGTGYLGPPDGNTNPAPVYPRNDLGLVATGTLTVHDDHTGDGIVMAGLYSETNVSLTDATAVVGSVVSGGTFTFSGQPSIFDAPQLASSLPPGVPGTTAFNTGGFKVINYQQLL